MLLQLYSSIGCMFDWGLSSMKLHVPGIGGLLQSTQASGIVSADCFLSVHSSQNQGNRMLHTPVCHQLFSTASRLEVVQIVIECQLYSLSACHVTHVMVCCMWCCRQVEMDFKAECTAGDKIECFGMPLTDSSNGNGKQQQFLHLLRKSGSEVEVWRARTTWTPRTQDSINAMPTSSVAAAGLNGKGSHTPVNGSNGASSNGTSSSVVSSS
jgi:hypothetical protein